MTIKGDKTRPLQEFTRTEAQVKAHEGFRPEALTAPLARTASEGDRTAQLANPPGWALHPGRNCAGRWEEFDDVQREDRARELCAGCPVADACLQDAMEREGSVGGDYRYTVRGGMTPAARGRLSRRLRDRARRAMLDTSDRKKDR